MESSDASTTPLVQQNLCHPGRVMRCVAAERDRRRIAGDCAEHVDLHSDATLDTSCPQNMQTHFDVVALTRRFSRDRSARRAFCETGLKLVFPRNASLLLRVLSTWRHRHCSFEVFNPSPLRAAIFVFGARRRFRCVHYASEERGDCALRLRFKVPQICLEGPIVPSSLGANLICCNRFSGVPGVR